METNLEPNFIFGLAAFALVSWLEWVFNWRTRYAVLEVGKALGGSCAPGAYLEPRGDPPALSLECSLSSRSSLRF